jgi:hypothetical protein
MSDARKNDFIFINKNDKTEHRIGNKLTLLHQRMQSVIIILLITAVFFI